MKGQPFRPLAMWLLLGLPGRLPALGPGMLPSWLQAWSGLVLVVGATALATPLR